VTDKVSIKQGFKGAVMDTVFALIEQKIAAAGESANEFMLDKAPRKAELKRIITKPDYAIQVSVWGMSSQVCGDLYVLEEAGVTSRGVYHFERLMHHKCHGDNPALMARLMWGLVTQLPYTLDQFDDFVKRKQGTVA
jgi:hypothetical protein